MGAASRKYQMLCLLKNVILYVSCNTTQGEACSADVLRTIFHNNIIIKPDQT